MDQPFALWITGLPASGKSAITRLLAEQLRRRTYAGTDIGACAGEPVDRSMTRAGVRVQVLESDLLRQAIAPVSTYSPEERAFFYRVMVHMGVLLVENGIPVIFDATANRRAFRELARKSIARFMEVYVQCPLAVCMARDPKGIYKRGMDGLTQTVPGLQDPYEVPDNPDVLVSSDRESPEDGCKKIISMLEDKRWI